MSKILIVEDTESLAKSLKEFLDKEAFHVTLVSSLGLAKVQQLHEFDLMILDWMLPDGQGVDFLRELRSAKFRLPIIILSARADLLDKVLGLELGANDYLTKPFEPRELLARIRAHLRERNSLQQIPAPLTVPNEILVGPLRIDRPLPAR